MRAFVRLEATLCNYRCTTGAWGRQRGSGSQYMRNELTVKASVRLSDRITPNGQFY